MSIETIQHLRYDFNITNGQIHIHLPLGALPVVFHSVGMTDVEGQLYTARGKHLEAIALVGLEGLWGKVWVIVFIHLGIHSSQYKSTPGQLLGWG